MSRLMHTLCFAALPLLAACSSNNGFPDASSDVVATDIAHDGDASSACGTCSGATFTPCNADGTPGESMMCPAACANGVGCVPCVPNGTVCMGNDVYRCGADGQPTSEMTQSCDVAAGMLCRNGSCQSACQIALGQPSNVGCEFWAVDLDQQDALNDPASAPWGVALSNVGESPAHVTIEINDAPVGQPPHTTIVQEVDVDPGSLRPVILPTREVDCGTRPNDYASPGTCLSSNAFRITATSPIIVYQYNVFENAYSNDASLLLPSSSLGRVYRAVGWPAGHPVPVFGLGVDRSYVTIVGTRSGTQVTVRPTWRIRGNAPIAATMPGGEILVTLGPFDVLNLETDDGTFADDGRTIADLSGTSITSTEPVAVFSGVESTSAPGAVLTVPEPPGGMPDGCCLDHLEDQMFPIESIGTRYVIPRSPVRSTSSYREPDIIRFVGAAEPALVTTSLPAPFDSFMLQPGEVRTTWTQDNIVVTSDKPVIVGQILVSNSYVDGPFIGDPSLTVFPPVDQFRSDYIILTPSGWTQSWGVIVAEPGASVTIDGAAPSGCITESAGAVGGVSYESRRCPLVAGAHRLASDRPFGVVVYGYGSAGSYAVVGGADVRRIYDPPG